VEGNDPHVVTRLLCVCDDTVDRPGLAGRLTAAIQAGHHDGVDLCYLGSNVLAQAAVAHTLRAAGLSVTVLEAGRLVDDQVTALRTAAPQWTDAVGAAVVNGRRVLDWLALSSVGGSVFWLGSLIERNTFKSRELLAAAQVRAIDRHLAGSPVGHIHVSVAWPLVSDAVAGIAKARGIVCTRTGGAPQSAKARLLERPVAGSLALLARQAWWSFSARGLRLRPPASDRGALPLLFVTYFPYLERTAAGQGMFRNKYAGQLQDVIESSGRPLWWVGLFVFIDGFGFADAVRMGRRFAQAGRFALLDAYLGVTGLLGVVRDTVRVWRRAGRVGARLDPAIARILVPPGAEGVAQEIWRRSYQGPDLVRSLCYAAMFRALGRDVRDATECLYYLEFQAWEQALNLACRQAQPSMRRIAFQHTSVSRNHLFYFRTAEEQGPDGMPMPDVVVASGDVPAGLLRETGLDPVPVAESIRQLHLWSVLAAAPPSPRADRPVLVVAGSIDRVETTALVSMVVAAFPVAVDVDIQFKGHPSMPIAPILSALGVDMAAAGYTLATGTVGEALTGATMVLVASSAVAVEALAFGCDVIVPAFPSFPCLTPLAGFDEYCLRVYTADGLRAAVHESQTGQRPTVEARQAFARAYWSLDSELSGWRRVLGHERS